MKHILKLLIVAMLTLSSFFGCTSHVDLTADEIGPRSSGQIDRIVFTRSITGVITDLGDTMQFDEQCGEYDHGARAISGRVDGGELKEIKLNQIKSVLVESDDLRGVRVEELYTIPFMRTARKQPWLEHNGKTVQRGLAVSLRKGSGILSEDREQFSGSTLLGRHVIVNTHDVILQRKQFSPGKTVALLAGVGAVVGAIIAIKIANDFKDWGHAKY